jgi:hypothetical protein
MRECVSLGRGDAAARIAGAEPMGALRLDARAVSRTTVGADLAPAPHRFRSGPPTFAPLEWEGPTEKLVLRSAPMRRELAPRWRRAPIAEGGWHLAPVQSPG